MAISNILPRKTMHNRSRQRSMKDRLDYDQKPAKTNDGEWVSSYMCSPETAAEEFEISKQLYHQITGRSQPVGRDVIMYRVIQSFKPGEISPEEANRIGYELAMKFTRGQHQFVVSTHVDKAHIHTHIEFNSTNLNCDSKFINPLNSYLILRRFNDELCRAHGLSVIENPKQKAKRPGEAEAIKYGSSWKERLRQTIDRVLSECWDYEDFLAKMRAEGYEIKEGKLFSSLFSPMEGIGLVESLLLFAEIAQYRRQLDQGSKCSWTEFLAQLEGKGPLWDQVSMAFHDALIRLDFKPFWQSEKLEKLLTQAEARRA